MPEITPIEIAVLAGMLVLGIVLGWIFRSGRCAREKIAVNAGWQEQLESQRSEHERLAGQSAGSMSTPTNSPMPLTSLINGLRRLNSPLIKDVRGIGLFVGVEIDPVLGTAREVCERLMHQGILSKETHDTVVRLAPPLTITRSEIDWALERFSTVLAEMDEMRLAS